MCLQRFAVRFGHFFYIFSIFGYLDNLTSHIELSLYFYIPPHIPRHGVGVLYEYPHAPTAAYLWPPPCPLMPTHPTLCLHLPLR